MYTTTSPISFAVRGSMVAAVLMLMAPACVLAQGAPSTPTLVAGRNHVLATDINGTIRAWGRNDYGQLGIGNVTNQTTPQLIPGSSNVTAVGAAMHSLARLQDGTVKAWGRNDYGQLGIGNMINQSVPQVIANLSNVADVACGTTSSYALLSNGTVKSWGRNNFGQLGLGNTIDQVSPQVIPNLTGVTALAAGHTHVLVLLQSGAVKSFGGNASGELGLGNTVNQATPQVVAGLTNITAVAAGQYFSFAVSSSGAVSGWGYNEFFQLGLGNDLYMYSTPQATPNLANVVKIALGEAHGLALLQNGTVKVWGNTWFGQGGFGTTPFSTVTPQPIPNLTNVVSVSAGSYQSYALLQGGTVKAWGANQYGELGIGSYGGSQLSPVQIPGLSLCAASYGLAITTSGVAVAGITIPCNTEVGALGPGHCYFNAFSLDPLNATNPHAGSWYGLHIAQADLLAWLDAGAGGLAIAYGSLGASGGASASSAIALAPLSGMTVYGVSIAVNPLTNQVVADSNVASHTF